MESEGLRVFLRSVGRAVGSVNTIWVGLDGVADGRCQKSPTLTITWNPTDPRVAADHARRFAIQAALVFVEEALLEYFRYIASLEGQSSGVVSALGADGAAKRVEELAREAVLPQPYWTAFVVLMIRWRNRIVHNSDTTLSTVHRKTLKEYADVIRTRHGAIDVMQTLQNHDNRKITLKDFTTMIAVTIRYVRALDELLAPRIVTSGDFVAQIQARQLWSTYKRVVGATGPEVQERRFFAFLKSEFPRVERATGLALFEERFKILARQPQAQEQ